ncbi:MAG: alpha-galactosidase, partial [Clostridia bacterium]|nr:alpha-galactosidase [Clostridia bacterium]
MKKLFEDVRAHLLSGMTLTFNRVHGGVDTLASYKEEDIENGIRMTYEPVGGNASAVIEAKFVDDAVIFYIDAVIPRANGYSSAFAPENAVTMTLGDMQPDALLGSHHDCPWWMLPSHPATFADIKMRTQSLLVRSGAVSYHMLPLCGDNFRCEMEKGVMALTSDAPALQKLTGAFLAVSVSTDPFAAIENNYKAARSCGAIRVPLRTERKFPEIFEGFGFCTWDCFYYTITSEKLYQKLDELKEKNIPVHWVIIDDGWLSVKNAMLTSFEEDRTKFPEGFKETIRRMKEDYGVEYVGVWHAFNGYWDGVDPESKLYEEQKDNLFMTPGGFCLPSLDEEKAFRFWDAWHSYLADCGVDFLKVDNQSSNSGRLLGTIPTAEACRIAHNAIERSINKNFNGVVIDCMGMDMENVLARPSSAVSRNSDDFFPRRERGFIKHLTQNVYS